MNIEKREVNCREILEGLHMFSRWCRQIVEYNGSDEVDEECNPFSKNYSNNTLNVFGEAGETASFLAVIAANLFMLHTDEISEDRLFSEIKTICEEMNMLHIYKGFYEEGEE